MFLNFEGNKIFILKIFKTTPAALRRRLIHSNFNEKKNSNKFDFQIEKFEKFVTDVCGSENFTKLEKKFCGFESAVV